MPPLTPGNVDIKYNVQRNLPPPTRHRLVARAVELLPVVEDLGAARAVPGPAQAPQPAQVTVAARPLVQVQLLQRVREPGLLQRVAQPDEEIRGQCGCRCRCR